MTVPGEAPAGQNPPEGDKQLLPPFVLLGALVAMGALHQLAPGPEIVPGPWNRLGWLGVAFGLAMAVHIDRVFKRHDTTIKPHEPTTTLVTDGPYAWSRNPIYFGMVLALAGVAVVLGTATPWLAIPGFAWLIQRRFIEMEEQKLEAAFGDAYRAYKARVRRWI